VQFPLNAGQDRVDDGEIDKDDEAQDADKFARLPRRP
jgi:hypothetical protein